MWRRLSRATKGELATLRRLGKARLYADEGVDARAVEFLRSNGVDVICERELGHEGRPASFHAAFACERNCLLLTRDSSRYLGTDQLPPPGAHGLIVISSQASATGHYEATLRWVLDLASYGGAYTGCVIHVGPEMATVRFAGSTGHITAVRFKVVDDLLYRWVEPQEGVARRVLRGLGVMVLDEAFLGLPWPASNRPKGLAGGDRTAREGSGLGAAEGMARELLAAKRGGPSHTACCLAFVVAGVILVVVLLLLYALFERVAEGF